MLLENFYTSNDSLADFYIKLLARGLFGVRLIRRRIPFNEEQKEWQQTGKFMRKHIFPWVMKLKN